MADPKNESQTLFEQWKEDEPIRYGASIALFSILSFAPLVVLLTMAFRAVGGGQFLSDNMVNQLSTIIGQNSAQTISNTLNSSMQGGWSLGIISILSLLLAVYAVARQLRTTLNEVFDVDREEPPQDEIMRNVRALAMVLIVGVVMVLAVGAATTLGALSQLNQSISIGTQAVLQIGAYVVIGLLISLLFGMIYKTVPDVDMRWRDLTGGTLAAGALFAVGTAIVAWYINSSAGVQSSMNMFGSVIVLMIWVLYASVMLLFGAELVQHMARRNGRRIQPDY